VSVCAARVHVTISKVSITLVHRFFNNLPNWTNDLVQNKKIYWVSCWGNQHVWDTIGLFKK